MIGGEDACPPTRRQLPTPLYKPMLPFRVIGRIKTGTDTRNSPETVWTLPWSVSQPRASKARWHERTELWRDRSTFADN
jgi:hypothetical protein